MNDRGNKRGVWSGTFGVEFSFEHLEVYSSIQPTESHVLGIYALQYETSYLQVPIVTSYWHRGKKSNDDIDQHFVGNDAIWRDCKGDVFWKCRWPNTIQYRYPQHPETRPWTWKDCLSCCFWCVAQSCVAWDLKKIKSGLMHLQHMSLVDLFPTSNSDIMLYVVHQHVVSAEGVHTFLSLTSINVHHDSGSKISLPRHSKNLRWHESALWRRQPAKHLQAHDIGWDFSSSFQSLRSLFTLSVLNSGIEQIIPVNPLSFINAILQPIPKCL